MEKMVKYGWYALIVAMAGDILVSFVLPCFYKGYSSMNMSISALGNPQSPVRIPFNIWMLIEGILFLAAVPALYRRYHPVSGGLTYTMIIFVAIFAIGACIFTCFFSVNESKEMVTTASKIHGVGSVIGFMLFLFVPVLLAILSFKNKESGIGIISILCFVLALTFFVLFVMSDKPEFSNTIISKEGLWERLNLIFMYVPLLVVSVRQIIGE
ncbi:MAG: DUF998 domain-containing protein [Lachnospiraceae bacterium]|nr:DUF998 domain-containing protein [Lachnospiraceae bacterium]